VPAGTILGLLGPNGAGKTTAVRILTTLALPDAGRANVAGIDVVRHPGEVRRYIGVTAQDTTLDALLTGRQNLVMVGELSGMGRVASRARAAELLAQFEPTEPISAEHQFQLVEHVYNECKKFDILLLLETVSFPFGGEQVTDASYLDRKARTVIESARQLSRFCDIYKSEFPGTLSHESEEQLEDNLHALDAASERPWVLLSAGVDYPEYLRQVELALGVGASGILGGRAFWKEYFLQQGAGARSQFAATTARQRLTEVGALVRSQGTPWFARYGLSKDELAAIRAAEGWHTRYGARGPSSAVSGSAAGAPGEAD